MDLKLYLNTTINSLTRPLVRYLQWRMLWETPPVHGQGKFIYGKACSITNTIVNTRSGDVILGNHVAIGQNCMLITGKHDYSKTGLARLTSPPLQGQDIIIEDGVEICAGCKIKGRVRIGEKSVIGMGSVVTKDIPPGVFACGNPAKVKYKLEIKE